MDHIHSKYPASGTRSELTELIRATQCLRPELFAARKKTMELNGKP